MKRPIVGYHLDDEGSWVAELECGHGQHVRHEPPWQVRPWVTSPEGRASFLGYELECLECDRDKPDEEKADDKAPDDRAPDDKAPDQATPDHEKPEEGEAR